MIWFDLIWSPRTVVKLYRNKVTVPKNVNFLNRETTAQNKVSRLRGSWIQTAKVERNFRLWHLLYLAWITIIVNYNYNYNNYRSNLLLQYSLIGVDRWFTCGQTTVLWKNDSPTCRWLTLLNYNDVSQMQSNFQWLTLNFNQKIKHLMQ